MKLLETSYNLLPEKSRTFFHILSSVAQLTTGQRLKDLRHRLGLQRGERLTQEWLAEQVGASKSSVTKWETDVQPPGPDAALRLAHLYDTTREYIMKGVAADTTDDGPLMRPPMSLPDLEAWLAVEPSQTRKREGLLHWRGLVEVMRGTVPARYYELMDALERE